jgi:hypothetical protein
VAVVRGHARQATTVDTLQGGHLMTRDGVAFIGVEGQATVEA